MKLSNKVYDILKAIALIWHRHPLFCPCGYMEPPLP